MIWYGDNSDFFFDTFWHRFQLEKKKIKQEKMVRILSLENFSFYNEMKNVQVILKY